MFVWKVTVKKDIELLYDDSLLKTIFDYLCFYQPIWIVERTFNFKKILQITNTKIVQQMWIIFTWPLKDLFFKPQTSFVVLITHTHIGIHGKPWIIYDVHWILSPYTLLLIKKSY